MKHTFQWPTTGYFEDIYTDIRVFIRISVYLPMDYDQDHLRKWLLEHDLISVSALEDRAEIPRDTLRHFKKDRIAIPGKHIQNLEKVLFGYGYRSLCH